MLASLRDVESGSDQALGRQRDALVRTHFELHERATLRDRAADCVRLVLELEHGLLRLLGNHALLLPVLLVRPAAGAEHAHAAHATAGGHLVVVHTLAVVLVVGSLALPVEPLLEHGVVHALVEHVEAARHELLSLRRGLHDHGAVRAHAEAVVLPREVVHAVRRVERAAAGLRLGGLRGHHRLEAQERLEEVVVGVVERHVDLAVAGLVADGVHEQEVAVLALLGEVGGRRHRRQHLHGCGAVLRRLRGRRERLELEERARGHRRSGDVALLADEREVPVGDAVGGEVRLVEPVVRRLHRALEVAPHARLAVHHREAVDAPCVAARPGALHVAALARVVGAHAAGHGIVVEDVVGTAVRTVMVRVRDVGLAARDLVRLRVAAVLGVPLEELEVHHVVDDHDVLRAEVAAALLGRVPAADEAEVVVEARAERGGRVVQELGVALVAREAQAVAGRAVGAEAHVVVARVVAQGLDQAFRVGDGLVLPKRVARVLVEVPERAGEEAAAPVLRLDRHELAVLKALRERIGRLGLHRLKQGAVMRPRLLEDAGQGLQQLVFGRGSGLYARGGRERRGQQQFLHDTFLLLGCNAPIIPNSRPRGQPFTVSEGCNTR